MNTRIVIIGGVAGGASAATRARRLDESAEIIIIERGPFVSFANCGLPYHLGGVIKSRDSLLLQNPQSLKARFNLDVRVLTEALSIDRESKTISVKDLSTSTVYSLAYDKLILSPGAEPFVPPIPGIDLPNVFTLKTIPDLDRILQFIASNAVKHATVIGGGFIGIETAENLREKNFQVALIEKDMQVMPPLDREMATLLHEQIRLHGVGLYLESEVKKITPDGQRLRLELSSGNNLTTDLIVLAIGVRPEVKLARDAGLQIGNRGGIIVNQQMQTSDPDILAVGDAVETLDLVSGFSNLVPLAGPANRQGRCAANTASASSRSRYQGTLGTWICKVFDLTVAQTGNSEKTLKRIGKAYKKIYLHPANHAGYYPNATPMTFKLLFDPQTENILGAQIVGREGVDKRIDVIATAIAAKMKVADLAHLELAYAPPYGSARDPINQAGLIAEGILAGTHIGITPDELFELPENSYILIDVRTKAEHDTRHIRNSLHIPVDELRLRISEIPDEKHIIVYCQVGLRGYFAQRILTQAGRPCRNLLGGFKTWLMFKNDTPPTLPETTCSSETPCSPAKESFESVIELNACGLQCPGPLMSMTDRIKDLAAGQLLKVVATDPGFLSDAASWCARTGHRLVRTEQQNGQYSALIEKTNPNLSPAQNKQPTSENTLFNIKKKEKLTMVVFSGDLDRAYATFIIATGAASMGMDVTLFFTFWGLNILRSKETPPVSKDFLETMFGMMMPKGPNALGLSKMHFGGLGTAMMKHVMTQKNVAPLPELIAAAQSAGVKFIACSMSMDVMGIKKSELIPGVEEGGVATFINSASESEINLFV